MMMSKPTKAEMEQRVTQVYTLLLNGASRADVLAYAAKTYDIATRQTDMLIKRARKQLQQRADYDRDEQFGQAVERFRLIFSKAMKVQDFRVAIAAQKEVNALYDLYPARKVEISHKLTPAENALLNDLLTALQSQDIPASELFDAMMQEIASLEQTTDDDRA